RERVAGAGEEPNNIPSLGQVEEAMRRLRQGRAQEAAILFTAAASADKTIREAAEVGIRTLIEPMARALGAPVQGQLSQPEWTTQDLARVREWWSHHVDDASLKALLEQQERSSAWTWERDRLLRIREITSHVVKTDLYLTGPPFPSPR